jgi:hypothetical protein
MSEEPLNHDVLIQRYLEGTLDEASAEQLLAAMQAQPELGRAMVDHVALDAMLRDVAQATQPVLPSAPVKLPRRFSFSVVASVAAMAACVTMLGAWLWFDAPNAAATEATTSAVAVLAQSVNAQWETNSPAPATDSLLSPGLLRLKSGVVQIEFFQGARVLLEGPAELRLVSVDEAFCARGKLSAHVPPQARGFKIGTPKGLIVDLGTEFGLSINDQDAQVHVFKGEVELHREGAMQSLKQGEGADFAAVGHARPVPADAAEFLSLEDLASRTAISQRAQWDRWQQQSVLWNHDPALRLRFDFQDSPGTRVLRNQATQSPNVPDGSIVGCAWTDGRWQGKRALAFRSPGDRVRLSFPGEYLTLTLAAWVRADGLDRQFNSLFMSQGWANAATHWQIMHDGRVRFGVASDGKLRNTDFDSPVVFTSERLGQWVHLALVFDGPRSEVRHYVNGERVSQTGIKTVYPVKPGIAELGNWNDTNRRDRTPIRNFTGAMDEFAAYARALNDDEVRAMVR